jgi:hypothetical protein
MGSARPVRVGFGDSWRRIDWGRPPIRHERRDSQAVAQIFSRAHECVGFAVSPATPLRQVCMMKHQLFLLRTALLLGWQWLSSVSLGGIAPCQGETAFEVLSSSDPIGIHSWLRTATTRELSEALVNAG